MHTAFFIKNVLKLVGLLSIIFGSFAAIFEDKLKKILGYSSVNQLGFVFLSLSVVVGSGISDVTL